MLKFASVLVALLVIENASAASFFQSISFGSCVDSPVISDFNKAKYLGRWYEQERSNVFFEDDLKCVFATYTDRNDTAITVVNRGLNFKTLVTDKAEGYAAVKNIAQPNKLEVSLSGNPPGKYDVWTTDYENYAVVYSCSQIIPFLAKFELMWILSRQPQLDSEIVKTLKQDLSSRGISIKSFKKTDQTDCTYEEN